MRIPVCACLALVALSLRAQADETFRCGRWVVTRELTPSELIAKCGEPTSRHVQTVDVYARNAHNTGARKVGTRQIETWRYYRGSRAAAMIATVVEGKIERLEREDR